MPGGGALFELQGLEVGDERVRVQEGDAVDVADALRSIDQKDPQDVGDAAEFVSLLVELNGQRCKNSPLQL